MGTIATRLFRPLKNWNIESRAHKIISKDKPEPAPTFNSTQKQINLVNQFEPDYKHNAKKKDMQLNDYLKKVHVKSYDSKNLEINLKSNPEKPLPKEKTLHEPFEFGFYESSKVEEGKISLRQAIEIIQFYNKEPEKYTIKFISNKYNLSSNLVADILEFYKIFEVFKFEQNNQSKSLATPLLLSLKSGIRIPHTKKNIKVKQKLNEEKKENNIKQIKNM